MRSHLCLPSGKQLVPDFTVCVRLMEATAEEATALHAAMLRAGFKNLLTGANGGSFVLPDGEYIRSAPGADLRMVRDEVVALGLSVSSSICSVLVTRSTGRAWQLPRAVS